jgi:hypothetical protein
MTHRNAIASLIWQRAIRYSMMGEPLKKQTLFPTMEPEPVLRVDGSTRLDTASGLVFRPFDSEPPHSVDKGGARNSETSGGSARAA